MSSLSWDSLPEVALVVTAGAYCAGVSDTWTRVGPGRIIRRWHAGCFLGGVLIAALAIASPFDGLADRSLPAHMAQHVILLMLVGPLLALGRPMEALAGLLSATARRRARRIPVSLARSAVAEGWAVMATVAVLVKSAVVLAWHLPGPYQLAVRNEAVHGLEHISLIVVSAGLWWVVLGAGRPHPAPGGILALFASNVPMTFLGVAMLVARTPWYPVYGSSLDPQQSAGAVLWGFGGAIMVIEGVAVFGWWLATSDSDTDLGAATPADFPAPARS